MQERLQAGTQVELRVLRHPNHDFPGSVLIERTRFGQSGGLKFLGVVEIRREEHVEWGTVLKLLKEISRGTIRQFHSLPCFFLKARGYILHDRLQICRCRDCDLLRSAHSGVEPWNKAKDNKRDGNSQSLEVHISKCSFEDLISSRDLPLTIAMPPGTREMNCGRKKPAR